MIWAVFSGLWDAIIHALPYETKSDHIKKASRSLVSFFKRGLRYLLRSAQQFIEVPSLWSLVNCCVKLLE